MGQIADSGCKVTKNYSMAFQESVGRMVSESISRRQRTGKWYEKYIFLRDSAMPKAIRAC